MGATDLMKVSYMYKNIIYIYIYIHTRVCIFYINLKIIYPFCLATPKKNRGLCDWVLPNSSFMEYLGSNCACIGNFIT